METEPHSARLGDAAASEPASAAPLAPALAGAPVEGSVIAAAEVAGASSTRAEDVGADVSWQAGDIRDAGETGEAVPRETAAASQAGGEDSAGVFVEGAVGAAGATAGNAVLLGAVLPYEELGRGDFFLKAPGAQGAVEVEIHGTARVRILSNGPPQVKGQELEDAGTVSLRCGRSVQARAQARRKRLNSAVVFLRLHADAFSPFGGDIEITLAGVEQGRMLVLAGHSDELIFDAFELRRCSLVGRLTREPAATTLGENMGQASETASSFVADLKSFDCSLSLSISADSVDTAALDRKVRHYVSWHVVLVLLLAQSFYVQTKLTAGSPVLARVSILSAWFQALMDLSGAVVHFGMATLYTDSFPTFAAVAGCRFALFVHLEIPYVVVIWRERHKDLYRGSWSSLRVALRFFYMQLFWGTLLGLLVLLFTLGRLHLSCICLQAVWVPQILLDVWSGCRSELHIGYLLGASFLGHSCRLPTTTAARLLNGFQALAVPTLMRIAPFAWAHWVTRSRQRAQWRPVATATTGPASSSGLG